MGQPGFLWGKGQKISLSETDMSAVTITDCSFAAAMRALWRVVGSLKSPPDP